MSEAEAKQTGPVDEGEDEAKSGQSKQTVGTGSWNLEQTNGTRKGKKEKDKECAREMKRFGKKHEYANRKSELMA